MLLKAMNLTMKQLDCTAYPVNNDIIPYTLNHQDSMTFYLFLINKKQTSNNISLSQIKVIICWQN